MSEMCSIINQLSDEIVAIKYQFVKRYDSYKIFVNLQLAKAIKK